jgi:hypothetical protein
MSEDITPEMWKCLEWLAKKDVEFDLRQRGVSPILMDAYHALVKKGYARVTYSGAGDSNIEFSITAAGEQALKSRR